MIYFTVATTSVILAGEITLTSPESLANNVLSTTDVLTENTAIDDQDESLCHGNNSQFMMLSLNISHQVGDQPQVCNSQF